MAGRLEQKIASVTGVGSYGLGQIWTRIEPLANDTVCFEELLHGSTAAKIWLTPSV